MKSMRRVYLLLSILIIVLSLVNFISTTVDDNDDEAWNEFKRKFNKTYVSKTDEERRKKVFLDNKHFIENQNTKATKASFTQGINPLSDFTTEEINNSRNGFRIGELENHSIDGLLETLLLAFNGTVNYDRKDFQNEELRKSWFDDILSPVELDWRTLGRVSKVKDQGSCGSCWAFSTTGALESILASRNRSILLSEQNLVDCSGAYKNHGCGGGLMDAALRYVRDNGIMSSRDYPYTAKDGKCKFNKDKSIIGVRGSARLPHGNEALLRLALALTGPIPVAIDASGRSFHSYKSGVYNDETCRNATSALNHAVLLVGYGTDQVGGDYWIVKNSWGTKWGDNGYIKIARNHRNHCGIASYAVLPIQ